MSAATVGLGGCLSTDDGSQASVLGSVVILNRREQTPTIDFRVRWEGELVHNSTHELTASNGTRNSGVVPARTWPDTPGQFTVSARLSDTEWKTANPADWGYPECFGIAVSTSPNEGLSIYVSTDRTECSDEVLERGHRANASDGDT